MISVSAEVTVDHTDVYSRGGSVMQDSPPTGRVDPRIGSGSMLK